MRYYSGGSFEPLFTGHLVSIVAVSLLTDSYYLMEPTHACECGYLLVCLVDCLLSFEVRVVMSLV